MRLSYLPQVFGFFAGGLTLAAAAQSPDSTASALWPLQSYKSSSIKTPFMNVTKNGQTEPGFIFSTLNDLTRGQNHPAIYSDDGQLVWHGTKGSHRTLQAQTLNGEPVLAYWDGFVGGG